MGFFSACLCVLINSQSPLRSECTRQYILARRRQANMRVSHLSPAARNRQENLGGLLHKRCLLLQRKHQVSVALCLRSERSKFPTSYTKSRESRMRVLFHAFQAQGNPAKICCGHVAIPIPQREYRISPLADGMCLPLVGGSGSNSSVSPISGFPTFRNHMKCSTGELARSLGVGGCDGQKRDRQTVPHWENGSWRHIRTADSRCC